MAGMRQGTAKPMTSGGRMVRLGTASLVQQGDLFIDAGKLNAKNIAKKQHVAKSICDYLIYVDNNFRRALDIAAEST